MNATHKTHVVPDAQMGNSDTDREQHAPPQSRQHLSATTGLRYGLLVGIALLLASLTWTMLHSIRETEAEIATIHAQLASLPTW